MVTCEECGVDLVDGRGCSYCEGTYCQDHRLPEHHDCTGVRSRTWNDWGGGTEASGRTDRDR